jgi:hypothetical protein
MSTLLAIAASCVVVLNLCATYVILRSPSYTPVRKAAQMFLVWAVPALGAMLCIMFARTDSLSSPSAKPQEFYENIDSSGSDH